MKNNPAEYKEWLDKESLEFQRLSTFRVTLGTPKPKTDKGCEFVVYLLISLLIGLVLWKLSGSIIGTGGDILKAVVLICFIFPIIPIVIGSTLLICLLCLAREFNQRSIIRSELGKFHNRRR